MNRDRLIQLGSLAAAAAALVCAGWLQGPIESERTRLKLVTVAAGEATAKHPKTALLQVAPGGLRAPFFNYLWIRSQQLKEEGKFFDAQQLRDLICDLMPHFSGVWAFHAWDMAWNISVATHTEPERWMWVSNGMKLIRDKGLYYNPEDLILYKELAWIFFSKIGQYIDEMHMAYKRRWAEEMDWVLGAPPPTGLTKECLDAFRLIAAAPQAIEVLRADEQAGAFLDRLAAVKLRPGEAFLRYYNRFAGDPLAGTLQPAPRQPVNQREKDIAECLADPALSAGRKKVLAFARRKVLSERCRMDPAWMLKLMEKYGPMDWRSANAHAIYWSTMGLHRAAGLKLAEISPALAEAQSMQLRTQDLDLYKINRLNTERIVLAALKSLTRTGQLYVRRARDPADAERTVIEVEWLPDWRFIEPAHAEYVAGGAALTGSADRLDAETNTLRDGHVTYLEDVVLQLYFAGRTKPARHYLDEIKNRLKPTTELYKKDPSLQEFVRDRTAAMGTPPAEMARVLWTGGLRAAYGALAGGDAAGYVHYQNFARRAYYVFLTDIGQARRLRPPPFGVVERNFLVTLLLRPQAFGANLPLLTKSRLYTALTPWKQQAIYSVIAGPLRRQCRQEGVDFEAAFPPPLESRQIAPAPPR